MRQIEARAKIGAGVRRCSLAPMIGIAFALWVVSPLSVGAQETDMTEALRSLFAEDIQKLEDNEVCRSTCACTLDFAKAKGQVLSPQSLEFSAVVRMTGEKCMGSSSFGKLDIVVKIYGLITLSEDAAAGKGPVCTLEFIKTPDIKNKSSGALKKLSKVTQLAEENGLQTFAKGRKVNLNKAHCAKVQTLFKI